MIKLELDSLRIKFNIRNIIKKDEKKIKKKKTKKAIVPRSVYHKSPDELLKLLVNRNVVTQTPLTQLSEFIGGYNLMGAL